MMSFIATGYSICGVVVWSEGSWFWPRNWIEILCLTI